MCLQIPESMNLIVFTAVTTQTGFTSCTGTDSRNETETAGDVITTNICLDKTIRSRTYL